MLPDWNAGVACCRRLSGQRCLILVHPAPLVVLLVRLLHGRPCNFVRSLLARCVTAPLSWSVVFVPRTVVGLHIDILPRAREGCRAHCQVNLRGSDRACVPPCSAVTASEPHGYIKGSLDWALHSTRFRERRGCDDATGSISPSTTMEAGRKDYCCPALSGVTCLASCDGRRSRPAWAQPGEDGGIQCKTVQIERSVERVSPHSALHRASAPGRYLWMFAGTAVIRPRPSAWLQRLPGDNACLATTPTWRQP